ncbi:hypothetical protein LPJ61_006331, partial [Coemansia biformis]
VRMPVMAQGTTMIPDMARHVMRVTGAMPNELHNDGVRKRISVQCGTVAKMAELQRHPFIWEGVAYAWYMREGRTTHSLILEPAESCIEEELDKAVRAIGRVSFSLSRVITRGIRLGAWTCVLELTEDKEPPTVLTNPKGKTIAKVFSTHTHRASKAPVALTGSAGTMGPPKVAVPMVLDQGPFTFESDTCNNELPSNIPHTPAEFKMGEVDPSKVMLGM